jgi:hypothetical protein
MDGWMDDTMSQEIRKSEDDIQASHFLVSQLVSHPF